MREQLIQLNLAEDRAKGRLRELRSLVSIVEYYDHGAPRRDHPKKHDGVHLQRDVVARDDVLRRNFECLLAQGYSHDFIDRREDQEDARPLRLRKQPAEAEDDAPLVFRKDLDRAENVQNEKDDDDQKADVHAADCMTPSPAASP